jgi:5-formyltetrahydrofolate cyclo-ligase
MLDRILDERPLHRRVRDRVRDIALSQPLGQRSVIPPEPELAAMMDVSRGTVRKAVDSVVAEGLLVREQGRGTFVDPDAQVRRLVADRLAEVAKPDSRLDDDFQSFIPDFQGSDACAEAIAGLPVYEAATTIFVSRDNNLQPLRQRALLDGKRLVVPSHALRTGLRVLESVPAGEARFASTLDGLDEFAEAIPINRVASLAPIALAVTGAVAATREGAMFGAQHDYFKVEAALLTSTGSLADDALMIGVVHDCQVIELGAGADPQANVLDLVVTPTATYRSPKASRPTLADVDRATIEAIPDLREMIGVR